MQTVINNISIESVASWLPENKLEMRSLGTVYGEAEVENIIKTTGVERSSKHLLPFCFLDLILVHSVPK